MLQVELNPKTTYIFQLINKQTVKIQSGKSLSFEFGEVINGENIKFENKQTSLKSKLDLLSEHSSDNDQSSVIPTHSNPFKDSSFLEGLNRQNVDNLVQGLLDGDT